MVPFFRKCYKTIRLIRFAEVDYRLIRVGVSSLFPFRTAGAYTDRRYCLLYHEYKQLYTPTNSWGRQQRKVISNVSIAHIVLKSLLQTPQQYPFIIPRCYLKFLVLTNRLILHKLVPVCTFSIWAFEIHHLFQMVRTAGTTRCPMLTFASTRLRSHSWHPKTAGPGCVMSALTLIWMCSRYTNLSDGANFNTHTDSWRTLFLTVKLAV